MPPFFRPMAWCLPARNCGLYLNRISVGNLAIGIQRIEADVAISVSDLKKNPSAVFAASAGQPVAVLNHNKVMAYMVPPGICEEMLEMIEDLELARIVREREADPAPRVPVNLDEI